METAYIMLVLLMVENELQRWVASIYTKLNQIC